MITQLPLGQSFYPKSHVEKKYSDCQENIKNNTIPIKIQDIYKKFTHLAENNEIVIFYNIYFSKSRVLNKTRAQKFHVVRKQKFDFDHSAISMKTFVHGAMSRSQKSFKQVWRCHQLLFGFLANDQLPPEVFKFELNATGRMIMQPSFLTGILPEVPCGEKIF